MTGIIKSDILKKRRIKNIIRETQYILDETNRIVNKRALIGGNMYNKYIIVCSNK